MRLIMEMLRNLNAYRTVSKDGAQFDTRFLWLENRCTLLAAAIIIIAIGSSVIYYALHESLTTRSILAPSFADYSKILTTYEGKLIGGVHCKCEQSVLPWATASGGFIGSASFTLDPICNEYNVSLPSSSKTFAELREVGVYNVAEEMSMADTITSDYIYGCKDLSSYNAGLVSEDQTSIPYADCATTQAIVEEMLTDLNDQCQTAYSINQLVLNSWLKDSFLTPNLLDKSLLDLLVKSKLDSMAVQQGIRFYISTDKRKVVRINEAHPAQVFKKNVGIEATEYQQPCTDFRLGPASSPPPKSLNLTEGLLECASTGNTSTQALFTARCCNRAKPTAKNLQGQCDDPVKLPCTEQMVQLGKRLKQSTYDSIVDAIKGAFLEGNSPNARAARKYAQHLLPPTEDNVAQFEPPQAGEACNIAMPVQCWDSSCAATLETCPVPTDAAVAAHDAASGAGAGAGTLCAGTSTPYQCQDNSCAATSSDCPGGGAGAGAGNLCAGTATPHQCQDNSCAATSSDCPGGGAGAGAATPCNGTATPHQCPDSSCATSSSSCPGGGRRLKTSDAGGFRLGSTDTSDEMFRRYFGACSPSECTYHFKDTPSVNRLVLIISGLVGGLITVGKGAGMVMLFGSKGVMNFRGGSGVKVADAGDATEVKAIGASSVLEDA